LFPCFSPILASFAIFFAILFAVSEFIFLISEYDLFARFLINFFALEVFAPLFFLGDSSFPPTGFNCPSFVVATTSPVLGSAQLPNPLLTNPFDFAFFAASLSSSIAKISLSS
jgi:hypothetical protein